MNHLQTFENAAKFIRKSDEAAEVLRVLEMLPESVKNAQIALYKISILSEAAWKGEGKVLDRDSLNQNIYNVVYNYTTNEAWAYLCEDEYYDSMRTIGGLRGEKAKAA